MRKENHVEDLPGTERLLSFSDPIFAFAITLLAINLTIPPHLAPPALRRNLVGLAPDLVSYAVSYIVISINWFTHSQIFRYVKRADALLSVLNLLFLISITFMPFLTTLMVNYRKDQIAVVIYATFLALVSLLAGVIWSYANIGRRLVDGNVDPRVLKSVTLRVYAVPVVFLVSIGISFISPHYAIYFLLLLAFVPLLGRLAYRGTS